MPATEEIQAVEKLMEGREVILRELNKVIIGQKDVIEQIFMVFFAGGHCLFSPRKRVSGESNPSSN